MLNPKAIYTFKLSSGPNPDFGERDSPKRATTIIGNLTAVFLAAKDYRAGLGGGNWRRADLYLGRKLVGYMSYNGRIWAPGEWSPGAVPLAEPPAWFNGAG